MNNNEKIVNRFLKETGLYSAFREYIYYLKNRKRYLNKKEREIVESKSIKIIYEEPFVDKVFGKLDFTSFLNSKKGIVIDEGETITDYFRCYLENFYPCVEKKGKSHIAASICKICKETHTIKIPITIK